MEEMEMLDIMRKEGAYLSGHFRLSSGLHSGSYLQCALILANPILADRFCRELASKIRDTEPDVVIGPAMGGIIIAYELARALGARAMFTERNEDGKMILRRGFTVTPKDRILIAEDVFTTGKSACEVIELLRRDGIKPVGAVSIIDRSIKKLDFSGVRHESLIKLNVPVFEEQECPLCKEGIPIVKPGSRKQ
jgi:orotate phosphoribosyltransferase